MLKLISRTILSPQAYHFRRSKSVTPFRKTALTDYSTLGQLIDRYNRIVASTYPKLALDSSIVDLRDALAHGRISTIDTKQSLVLLKFDRPSNDLTTVIYSQELTFQWLDEQVDYVLAEVKKIANVPGNPFDKNFPL